MIDIPPQVTDTRNKILAFVQDHPKTTAIIVGVLIVIAVLAIIR